MSHPDSAGTGQQPSDQPSPASPASPVSPVSPVSPAAAPTTGAGPDAPASPAPVATPAQPPQPEYLMALEPPDPVLPAGSVPTVPLAPAGPAPAGPAPARRSRLPLVLVSIVAGLAIVASGVLAVFLVRTNLTLDETRDQLTAVEAALEEERQAHQGSIRRLEADLQRSQDDLAVVQQELEGAENMVELLRTEQSVIRRCIALNGEVVDAIIAGDEAAFDAVIDEAEEVCEEADQILGS